MLDKAFRDYFAILRERALADGGFASHPNHHYSRPDSTAWAILALAADGAGVEMLAPARSRLVADQLEDGRISISADHPEAFWPTPLAILAWQGSPAHCKPQLRAIHFLLETTGLHWPRKPGSPFGHDTEIRGWPWVANTHSWVEPTAMSLLALQVTGYGAHERAQEATRLLLDRQLPGEGWNYGNTFVFDTALPPLPESTGVVLQALADRVSRKRIQQSLDYLQQEIARLRTPFSLGWGLLGLSAWGERPDTAQAWILESLKRQEKYGTYDTTLLCLLLLAFRAEGGLASMVIEKES